MDFMLQSDRLIICPFNVRDEARFIKLHTDPQVNSFLPKRSAGEYRGFFLTSLGMPAAPLNRWKIIMRKTGNFLGACLLREFNPGEENVLEIGYSLSIRYWNQGYATEVVRLIKHYGLALPGVSKIVAITDPGNVGSKMVLLKNGFLPKGKIMRYDNLELCYFEFPGL